MLESAAIRFLQAFGGREDLHARQWASRDGRNGYTPVQHPLTPRRIQSHLAGNETLGVYCLRLDGTVNFMALDLDITKNTLEEALVSVVRARNLRSLLQRTTQRLYHCLADMGFEAIVENSGYKGRHFWILFAQPVPADVAHLFGSLLLRRLHHQQEVPPELHLEFFPKQADLHSKKGLGNLIKLPLGIHQKSGRRSLFLTPEGEPVRRWDQHLAAAVRHTPDQLYAAVETLKLEALPELPEAQPSIEPQRPAPAQVQRQWTEADFEADPQMQHLFQRCATLQLIKRQLEQHRQLNLHEQVVLTHSLGHLQHGVMAVNYLLARAANVSPEKYLKSQLKGNPISCPKIRSRIPHLTSKVACNCSFSDFPEQYPTPVLHLRSLGEASAPEPPQSLESLARRYATLEKRLAELQHELQDLGDVLAQGLKAAAEPVLVLPEGRYCLRLEGEAEVLVWEPLNAEERLPAESSQSGA